MSPLPPGERTGVVQEGGRVRGGVDRGWGKENWEMGKGGEPYWSIFQRITVLICMKRSLN